MKNNRRKRSFNTVSAGSLDNMKPSKKKICTENTKKSYSSMQSNSACDNFSDNEDFEEVLRRKRQGLNDLSTREDQKDTVLLGSEGWKERYYKTKFGIEYNSKGKPEEQHETLKKLFHCYAEGLVWVYRYYYEGCPSWKWYFPFHYAPFASDLVSVFQDKIKFELGVPFKPLAQLMGVLPAASGHCMPESLNSLMIDKKSPIIDFYPIDFKLDLNGKKFAWQAVALLPFIHEKRLLDAIEPIFETLDYRYTQLNSVGPAYIFVNRDNSLGDSISLLYNNKIKKRVALLNQKSQGISGYIKSYKNAILAGETLPRALHGKGSKGWDFNIANVSVISCEYELPDYKPHITKTLDGAIVPPKVLTFKDHEYHKTARRFGQPRLYRKYQNQFAINKNSYFTKQNGYNR